MQAITRLLNEPQGLKPEDKNEEKYWIGHLWSLGGRSWLQGWDGLRDQALQECNCRCVVCSQRVHRNDVHHMIPWREAFALYDGYHARNASDLSPLCQIHHAAAETETISRDEMVALRNSVRAHFEPFFAFSVPNIQREFEAAMAHGNYKQSFEGALLDVRIAKTDMEEATYLINGADAARGMGSAKIAEGQNLLKRARDLVPTTDDKTWSRIHWVEGKCHQLKHELKEAADSFERSAKAATDELSGKQAKYSKEWVVRLNDAGRYEAPEVSFQSDCGITQFAEYRDDPDTLSGTEWYVYQILNCGLQCELVRDRRNSLKYFAEAGDLTDRYRLRGVRPKLYQNLALAFQARNDLWRCILFASASLALADDIGRQENYGLTLLIFLEALEALGLRTQLELVLRRISERKIVVDRDMNNQWAVDQIKVLLT